MEDATILRDVVSQHAEEAAFLWLLREAAVRQPHYSVAARAWLDNRVEAHLDGLRENGEPAWEILKHQLIDVGEAGEVFAAGVLALESGEEHRVQSILEVAGAALPLARGFVSALGWLPYSDAKDWIGRLAARDQPPLVRRIGIAAAAVHRQYPGQVLDEALVQADPLPKARALRAVGELGLVRLLPVLSRNLTPEDPECRFWAAWSAALLAGDGQALSVLRSFAESEGPRREQAVWLAPRRMRLAEVIAWREKLAARSGGKRLAILAVGAHGDPECVPWLIGQMSELPFARVAGEAFEMITGADIVDLKLESQKPEGFEAGATENPEDESVAMDLDDDLPWPNPQAIEKWWQDHQGQFAARTRHLLGKPLGKEWLEHVLQHGRQRQRAGAALELAILQPGQPLVEVRAPAYPRPPARPVRPPAVPRREQSAPAHVPEGLPPAQTPSPPPAKPPSFPAAQRPQEAAPFRLEIVSGTRAGELVPVKAGRSLYVGRHETAHLSLADDGQLSDTHFALECDSRGCRVRDLGSRSGTFVNGKKIHEEAILPGDRIEAGRTAFVLRGPAESAPPP